ncbi:MAG: hypothetical protein E7528_04670 [Ruminococcaceae bacterium]|nr:hypothetical protein [Oscillospiraceae bacterium]
MSRKYNRYMRFISVLLIVIVAFKTVDFTLSEITDIWAYEDVGQSSGTDWAVVYEKLENGDTLTEKDYDLIFSQTGLGKPAVDVLTDNPEKIEEYRDYYLADKDYSCVREGVFACHEYITDTDGNAIQNPPFANLQNGDIIITLSIHSLGWRHGHAAIVVDAEKGTTAQAVMLGEKSAFGHIGDWRNFPLVAVLRPKNVNAEIIDEVVAFTEEKLIGIDYSLMSGIFSGRDENTIPTTTHCAHYVWYAYKCFGIDIDSNGGRIVTPKEILNSDKLEVVQVYGNIKDL